MPSDLPINDTTLTIIVVIVAVLVVWTLLKVVARVVAALIVIGLLVAGLAVVAGQLTGRPPEAVVESVVGAVTTEATRALGDLPARDEWGRLDKIGGPPTPRR